MARVCHGECDSYKNIIHTSTNSGGAKKDYANGWKKCALCEYNIKTSVLRCNCCKGLFRTRTRR